MGRSGQWGAMELVGVFWAMKNHPRLPGRLLNQAWLARQQGQQSGLLVAPLLSCDALRNAPCFAQNSLWRALVFCRGGASPITPGSAVPTSWTRNVSDSDVTSGSRTRERSGG